MREANRAWEDELQFPLPELRPAPSPQIGPEGWVSDLLIEARDTIVGAIAGT